MSHDLDLDLDLDLDEIAAADELDWADDTDPDLDDLDDDDLDILADEEVTARRRTTTPEAFEALLAHAARLPDGFVATPAPTATPTGTPMGRPTGTPAGTPAGAATERFQCALCGKNHPTSAGVRVNDSLHCRVCARKVPTLTAIGGSNHFDPDDPWSIE